MKKNMQESLDKIKYLMEFHFKPNSIKDSVDVSEAQPVSFKEIGDVYKADPDHDYPTFESYRDNVIMDEEEENPDQTQGQPQPAATDQQPAVQGAPAPMPAPEPQPQQAAPAPMPEPAPAPEPMPVTPEPQAQTEPAPQLPADDNSAFSKMDLQMSKTDEMLAKFELLQHQLTSVQDINAKLTDVEKKLDDMNNPPYEEQLEMISKNSYPYNVKLSDFWGWDDKEDSTEEEKFEIKPDDITSYNKDEIKNSFN